MSKRLQMLDALIEKGSEDAFHHYARAMELRSLERLDEALAAFGTIDGAGTDAEYRPARYEDGKLIPGEFTDKEEKAPE